MGQLQELTYTEAEFIEFIEDHLSDESDQRNDWVDKYLVSNLIEAVNNAVLVIGNSLILRLTDGVFEIPFKEYESPIGFADVQLFELGDLEEISVDTLNEKIKEKQKELEQLQSLLYGFEK